VLIPYDPVEGRAVMERRWVATVASDACSFTAGLAAAMAQVVLVRELFGALEGHEVSVALSLALWVLGIACGALAGGRISRERRLDTGHLVAAAALLALAAFGGLALLRDARALLSLPRGGAIGVGGSLLVAALGVIPAAFVTGMLLPLYARASERVRGLRCSPGRFYAVDALGTACGGALAPFVVGWAPAPRLVCVCSALAAGAPVVAAWLGLGRPHRVSSWMGGLGLAALAVLALFSDPFERATQARRRASLGVAATLGTTVESPYERLDVAGRGPGRSQVTVLGNGAVVAVAPDPYGAGALLDLLLFEHPAPHDVLVVGSSPPDAVRVALAHGARNVTLATFDPWVLDVLRTALAPAERAWLDRATVLDVDARAHLREVPAASYDVILLFAPEPLTALANRFYTREAFADAARALRPDGVLALRLPWSANVPDPATLEFGRSVVRALRSAFPRLAVMPGSDAILFASRDPATVTFDAEALAERASWVPGIDARAYPPELFAAAFPPDQMRRLATQLGLDRQLPGPVNEDLRPVAYLDRLLASLVRGSTGLESKRASALPGALRALAGLPVWAWLLPLLFALPAATAVRRRRGLIGVESMALAAFVGGSGMALEMLLLVAYQVDTGRLYVGYALLTGAFMLGLAAGTHAGTRLQRRPGWGPREALGRLETCAALALFALWAAASWVTGSAALLVVASVLAGLLTGLPFPALTALAELRTADDARAGAWAMAGDNLGACLGALAATLILLPAYGFASSMLLLVAARACGALVVLGRGSKGTSRSGAE
jgi:spermidine synthase